MNIDFESFKTLLTLEHQSFIKDSDSATARQWKAALKSFEHSVSCFVAPYGLTATSSWGKGRWTYCPWLVMRYTDIAPTHTKGIYTSFTFGWNDHSAILSLIQGVEKTSTQERIRTKLALQKHIKDTGSFTPAPCTYPNIDYKGSSAFKSLVEDLVNGMTFWKAPYTPQTLTSVAQLEADIKELIGIYSRVRDFVQSGGLRSK